GREVFCGAPDDRPKRRLARIERVPAWKALPKMRDLPRPMALAMVNPRSLSYRTFANPRLRPADDPMRPEYRRLEFPAGGAIGSARDIARAYAGLVADPPQLEISPETMRALTRYPSPP